MDTFVDRRENPKGKSIPNRQRVRQRAKAYLKKFVKDSAADSDIKDVGKNVKTHIPTHGTMREPSIQRDRKTGTEDGILPGNKQFSVGDHIKRPQGGAGGGGKQGSDSGDGEDDFVFELSREEFFEIYFEDLELPDLVKRKLSVLSAWHPRRAGYSSSGTPSKLDLQATARKAFGRRLAFRRPSSDELQKLREKIADIESENPDDDRLPELRAELATKESRCKVVPYLDPNDLKYRRYENQPQPETKAVMFCLMDVSASMGEREKDLAKRFFVLLHLFLQRNYEKIDLVFIRHTQEAQEVDEDTFFHGRQTGGTVVSSALQEMRRIIDARYPPSEWNIYAAQASDGENYGGDSAICASLLSEKLLRVCQYFAYVEILEEDDHSYDDENGMELWRAYHAVAADWRNLAMKRLRTPADIYPVFRELFERQMERRAA